MTDHEPGKASSTSPAGTGSCETARTASCEQTPPRLSRAAASVRRAANRSAFRTSPPSGPHLRCRHERRHARDVRDDLRRGAVRRDRSSGEPPRPDGHGGDVVRRDPRSGRDQPRAGAGLRPRREPDPDGGRAARRVLRRRRPLSEPDRRRTGHGRRARALQHRAPPQQHRGHRRELRAVRLRDLPRRVRVGSFGGAGQDPPGLRREPPPERCRLHQLQHVSRLALPRDDPRDAAVPLGPIHRCRSPNGGISGAPRVPGRRRWGQQPLRTGPQRGARPARPATRLLPLS